MATANGQGNDEQQRRSFFNLLIEVLGWLQIVASPLLAGLIIGFLIYLSMPDTLGIILGTGVALIGLIIGIIWASKVWRKEGTIHFMSRMMATPELDKIDEE